MVDTGRRKESWLGRRIIYEGFVVLKREGVLGRTIIYEGIAVLKSDYDNWLIWWTPAEKEKMPARVMQYN